MFSLSFFYIVYQFFWYVNINTILFGKLLNMKEVRFAENLKNLRSSAGMTQKQLAHLMEVDQRTISAWEKSICEPSFELLAKLCDIFDETFDGILS